MAQEYASIFERYYADEPFVDRFAVDPADAIDVLIPVIHTNELWRANLKSIYREVPVNRLLISDGGCIDDSIEIAQEFPRVKVFDHREYVSLGYCIRKLIEAVETEWFAYLHSDVFLPDGWFDAMRAHQGEYDWFGCKMQITALIDYEFDYGERPYAGAQVGRKNAFEPNLGVIDDDYVYRQEDFVFERVVRDGGFVCGNVGEVFHYHQVIHKPSPWGRTITGVRFDVVVDPEEEKRSCETQAKGYIKYLDPTDSTIDIVQANLNRLHDLNALDWCEFSTWLADENPYWAKQLYNPASHYLRYWKKLMVKLMGK